MGIPPWDLCSIIGNLIDNALDATLRGQPPRRVSLELKYEESQYVIYVYNSGAKIPKQQENLLFTPGFSTSGSAGRGFGLYIVKRLVNKYGGSIRIVTQPKTTFIINLPDRRRMHEQVAFIENSV